MAREAVAGDRRCARILKRRDKIVARLERLARKQGEATVFVP